MKEINLYRLIFATFIVFFVITGFVKRPDIETNILSSILPEDESSQLLLNLTNKSSSKVNIIVEASNKENLENRVNEIVAAINESDIDFVRPDYQKIFAGYKNYSGNFLSKHIKNELSANNYKKVIDDAKVRLYDPFSFSVIPLEDDPFLFLNDYLANLIDLESNFYNFDGKYYSILTYNFDENLSMNVSELNSQIKKLIKIKSEFSTPDSKVYLSGAPIHSYFAAQNSIFDINLISVASMVFILVLVFWYFRSFKPIEPLIVSVVSAILTGFAACSILFHSVHILTCVFSATIIGICIDYSLHFFIESSDEISVDENIRRILKSVTVGLITTLSAFSVLFLSNIFLLKQISVFTMSGLLCAYMTVILFYPLFYEKIKNPNLNPKINFKLGKMVSIVISFCAICLIMAGFGKIELNNDVTSLYEPKGELLEAEKLYASLTQNDKVMLVVKSNELEDFQNHIEHEEFVIANLLRANKDAKIYSFSRYMPSVKTQKENLALISKFYSQELLKYATFLNKEQIEKFLQRTKADDYLVYIPEKDTYLNSFLISPGASIVIAENTPNLLNVLTDERVDLVDVKGDISAIVQIYAKRCIALILPVFAVMFVILSIVFGNKKALILLLPSFMGSCLAIAIPSIFHQQINFFNILSVFLIIGFGVDYSIFRYNSSYKSADAVFLSAATTIFSFSLLSFTSFKLISSIGLTLAIGLSFSYLFSLIFVRNRSNEKVV